MDGMRKLKQQTMLKNQERNHSANDYGFLGIETVASVTSQAGVCVLIFKKPLGWSKSRPNLKLIIRKLQKWNIILKESGHNGLMWLWWFGHFVPFFAILPIFCQSVFKRIIWTFKSHFENASENKRKSI